MHLRLLQLARKSPLALSITILSGLLIGLLALSQAYLLSSAVNGVFLHKETLIQVWGWLRLLLMVIALRGAMVWVNEVAANAIAVRVKTDLRSRLFAHILALGPSYSRGERTGELTTVAAGGIEALDAYFSQYLPQLAISILVPVSILIVVFPIDLLSGIVLLLTAPLIPFFMYLIGRAGGGVTRQQYETLGRFSAYFLDSLQGLTTLKLFGQSKAQVQNIARVSDGYRDATLKVLQVTFLSAFALELLATLSTAIIAVEVGLRLLYSQMQFREALFLLILAPEFYLPLRMLGMRFHAGMAGTSAARRIFDILDTPPSIVNDPKSASPSRRSVPEYRISDIELSNLSYTYPGETQPALENISLSIPAGQHFALVGATGAGKTTLAGILMRFIEPTSGTVTINSEPLVSIALDDWRSKIAWVPQNPHLFHESLAANIRLANPAAGMQEVLAAARAAHLDEFVQTLPEKYETVIGESGARLSSGQAQRLALARAYLKDASILILDEPTSSLDPELESQLEGSTRHLMHGRTVLTIAHRLNTVFNADQIVVLDRGRIVEIGTHTELLARNGIYARMVRSGGVGMTSASRSAIEGRNHMTPPARDLPRTPYFQPAGPEHHPSANLASPRAPSDEQPRTQDQQDSTFLRLLQFLKGEWGWVALSVLLGALTVGSNVALMGTSAWLISTAALHPSIAVLEVSIVGVRFFGIARAVFRYLERLVSHNVTFRLLGQLRVWFYKRLEPLAPARLMDFHAGDLLARIISDVAALENFYVRVVAPPMIALLVALGAGLFLGSSDPRFALLLVTFFVLIGLILPAGAQVLGRRPGAQVVINNADLHTQLVDGIQGLADVLAFGRGQARLEQLTSTGRKTGDAQQLTALVNGFHSAVSSFLTNFALWAVLLLAIPLCTVGRLDGVMLAPLALIMLSAVEAVTPLPLTAQMWSATQTAANRLFQVVDIEPAVKEAAPSLTFDSRISNLKSSNVGLSNIESSSIEFFRVSFTFPGQSMPALQDVSFDIPAGHNLAIVGPSGAGKTTLASLLLRSWDYASGDICLDGMSLKAYASDEVRSRIAYVSPNAYFFNTSIFENLRMARRNLSRAEVEAAARAAQIHDFILGLPKGYDTPIGEKGLRLSGGERQRLAIARAIAKDAPILIVDEPTANLDTLTEARILETLFGIMRARTSLLITHRLIGLERMDQILVMDRGSVVDHGSQAELLRSDGLFRRLWDLQNRFLAETS